MVKTRNMKTTLTPEQSATLIAKGISADKASGQGEKIYKPTTLQNGSIKRVFDGYAPIFTLADLISLTPKKITFGHRTNCRLKIQPIISAKDATSEVWQACYLHTSLKANAEADELIDALYELLLWCIDNRHIDLPK